MKFNPLKNPNIPSSPIMAHFTLISTLVCYRCPNIYKLTYFCLTHAVFLSLTWLLNKGYIRVHISRNVLNVSII